jgi:exodeoxyribonuclease VII large subunit
LRQLSSRLNLAMQRQQQQGQQRLAQAVQQHQHLRPDTAQAAKQLAQQHQALQQHWQHGLQQRHTRLQYQIHLLDAVSPQHILARGFSVVTNSRGQVVRQAAGLKPGQALHIRFAEGSADVRVNQQAQTDLFD